MMSRWNWLAPPRWTGHKCANLHARRRSAATALPLGVAFLLSRRPAIRVHTYGYGHVEDLAGILIVAVIAAFAVAAGWTAIGRATRIATQWQHEVSLGGAPAHVTDGSRSRPGSPGCQPGVRGSARVGHRALVQLR
jgi:hypothetical protein